MMLSLIGGQPSTSSTTNAFLISYLKYFVATSLGIVIGAASTLIFIVGARFHVETLPEGWMSDMGHDKLTEFARGRGLTCADFIHSLLVNQGMNYKELLRDLVKSNYGRAAYAQFIPIQNDSEFGHELGSLFIGENLGVEMRIFSNEDVVGKGKAFSENTVAKSSLQNMAIENQDRLNLKYQELQNYFVELFKETRESVELIWSKCKDTQLGEYPAKLLELVDGLPSDSRDAMKQKQDKILKEIRCLTEIVLSSSCNTNLFVSNLVTKNKDLQELRGACVKAKTSLSCITDLLGQMGVYNIPFSPVLNMFYRTEFRRREGEMAFGDPVSKLEHDLGPDYKPGSYEEIAKIVVKMKNVYLVQKSTLGLDAPLMCPLKKELGFGDVMGLLKIDVSNVDLTKEIKDLEQKGLLAMKYLKKDNDVYVLDKEKINNSFKNADRVAIVGCGKGITDAKIAAVVDSIISSQAFQDVANMTEKNFTELTFGPMEKQKSIFKHVYR